MIDTASEVPEVLLVEDSAADAELALRALRGRGIRNRIAVARDGAEALDLLLGDGEGPGGGRRLPRLVLLDLRLPRIDGMEVLRRIRSDPKTHDMPVVVLTSSRQDPDIQRCYDLGANSYIVKPVDFNKFVEAVSEIGFYWLLLNEPPR